MKILLKSITGRVRENDEDSVIAISFSKAVSGLVTEKAVLALADGMGGGSAGEVASNILISCVAEHFAPLLKQENISPDIIEEKIKLTVSEANERIASYASENSLAMIGTTACIAFVNDYEVIIGNVGDSRAYIINNQMIRQVTRDHSVVQELYEQGMITKDQMRTHPKKNLITKAVGLEEKITPDIFRTKLFGGEYLLLCCDGLWESMSEPEIMEILLSNEFERALDSLIETANVLDGSDNISAVLCAQDKYIRTLEEYNQLTTKRLESAVAERPVS